MASFIARAEEKKMAGPREGGEGGGDLLYKVFQ